MNRLADETSPYLRQHQTNPVDWYPWGPEAFAAAAERDCPVLLSIGYSSCHWCHVMAHESFEDPALAAVLNALFVCIKVDREERPDVDAIYLEAVQTMTGHAGWPLTVFLTPDGRPFFGGTYFAPERRGEQPSFAEVCGAVDHHWRSDRVALIEQADQLTETLRRPVLDSVRAPGEPVAPLPEPGWLAEVTGALVRMHDHRNGGFGGAPKFPQFSVLDLLTRQATLTPEQSAPEIAALTRSLDAMAAGGMYDHLGGGFARYSTDARWLIPHFEKMLYDNALAITSYTRAWQLTGHERYRQVVAETVGYLCRDLRQVAGGFASAQDADSEGEEGRFYVWTRAEVEHIGGPECVSWFGVEDSGNFDGARSVLHRLHEPSLLARPDDVERGRAALLNERSERVRPGLDDKVLTEWNALVIGALADAGWAFARPDWVALAAECGEFLWHDLRRSDGRWLRSWQHEGGARHLAYAADYAAVVDAYTRLGEASGVALWTKRAVEVARALVGLFWDETDGGFFTTGNDAELLLTRSKDVMDNPIPSANSTAAVALTRLAALTGDNSLRDVATIIVGGGARLGLQHPSAFSYLLVALDLLSSGQQEVVVDAPSGELLEVLRESWRPRTVLAWGEPTESPLWQSRTGTGSAYVCRDQACELPTADAGTFRRLLDGER